MSAGKSIHVCALLYLTLFTEYQDLSAVMFGVSGRQVDNVYRTYIDSLAFSLAQIIVVQRIIQDV
jgi:hypothetical protein